MSVWMTTFPEIAVYGENLSPRVEGSPSQGTQLYDEK